MSDSLPPVMVLGDHFGYAGGVAHGVTSYFLDVLPALARRGVDLTFCLLREPHPAASALHAHGITPIFLSAARWDPFVTFRLAKIAREKRVGVLHASGVKAALVARVVARMIGARAIAHVHDLVIPSTPVRFGHALAARPSDMAICVSRAVQITAEEGYHVDRSRLRVIHNGIHPERFHPDDRELRARVRAREGIAPDRIVIGMVARMYPVKGHRMMLKMMTSIVRACPAAMLMLVGDGPDRADCEALTDELGLREHVHFLGQRGDVPELLAAADIGVMPSESEGLGLAGLELLAAGCPLVTFDAGGMRDFVTDGVNGRLIAAGDAAAFANAVIELLLDPQLRATSGQRGRDTALTFSVEAHVERLISCYEESAFTGAVRLAAN